MSAYSELRGLGCIYLITKYYASLSCCTGKGLNPKLSVFAVFFIFRSLEYVSWHLRGIFIFFLGMSTSLHN
jgi:hypothetical protein